ncbi:hypothetical protein FHW96_002868 [Novosphingobium sp. SG751A]|uniref:hypothetical protein n=1 Tax=Novosphingobium sp. SG751A TaxID=2587000 RepID=UPI00155550D5|nr:hypothetical protein [Novosphingobium sp. SG751A]NOW46708.1 hypothetical protein [Novosphingobium sp. SG751A]
MVKITNLDLLDDDAIDGTETLPVVKGGKSWRARLADLAAPMVAAATAARDATLALLASTQAVAATLPYPNYASTAAAQADTLLFAGRQYTVLSGQQILIYTKNSPTASSFFGVIPTQSYVDRLKSRVAIPTVDYGAIGDGAHAVADQAGLAAAIAASAASVNTPIANQVLIKQHIPIVLEPGVYDAGGFTFNNVPINFQARVPNTVVIRNPDGVYFATHTGSAGPGHVRFDGLIFSGGLGVYNSTHTGTNATWQAEFLNCGFYNYTECAIGNNGADSPFLHVKNSRFGGGVASGNQTIGICWGGYVDELVIEDCYFGGNSYHIAIGPRLSGHAVITRCYFQGGNNAGLGMRTLADIWIKPNTTDSGETNSGHGIYVTYNKFGGELLDTAYPGPRILIANEDTTTGAPTRRQQYKPATNDAGSMSGLHIFGNKVGQPSPWSAPFIRSYISNIRYWRVNTNVFVGGNNSYAIEFPNGRSGNYSNNNNLFQFDDTAGSAPLLFTNGVQLGRLEDLSGRWPGDVNAVQLVPVSDDPTLAPVAVGLSGYEIGYGSGTTSVAVADPYGTTDYAAVTGLALVGFTDPYGGAGGAMFAEVSLSKAASNSLSYVVVDVVNYANSTYAVQKTVALPANGSPVKVTFPVLLPPNASPGTWQFRVYGSGIVAGSADTFVVGDMFLSKGNGRLGRAKVLERFGGVQPANRRLVGGAAATLPNGWSMSGTPAGATITVTKVGTDKYGDFVEFSHTGTTTGSGGWVLRPAPQKSMSYEAGSNYRCIWPVRIISGDFSAATTQTGYDGSSGKLTMQVGSYSAADGLLVQRGIAFTPNSTFALYGRTLTEGAAYFHNAADYLWPLLNINYASGVTLNTVFRVYAPIFNRTK